MMAKGCNAIGRRDGVGGGRCAGRCWRCELGDGRSLWRGLFVFVAWFNGKFQRAQWQKLGRPQKCAHGPCRKNIPTMLSQVGPALPKQYRLVGDELQVRTTKKLDRAIFLTVEYFHIPYSITITILSFVIPVSPGGGFWS